MSSLTVGNPAQVESSDVSNHVVWDTLPALSCRWEWPRLATKWRRLPMIRQVIC